MNCARILQIAALAVAAAGTSPAQKVLDPDRVDAVRGIFEAPTHAWSLRCYASPVRPALDFAMRFQTGYVIDVPAIQFHGSGHHLAVLLRVTPEHGSPIYMSSEEDLPVVPETDVPNDKMRAELTGQFIVGEGAYSVQAVVADEDHRGCYSTWEIKAQRSGSARDLRPATAPDTAEAITPPINGIWLTQPVGPKIERLAILLHAAPENPKTAAKIEPEMRRKLNDALASLVYQLPAKSVRVVVFSIDQRTELLRKEDFKLSDLAEVASAVAGLNAGVLDYKAQTQRAGVDVLRDLAVKEQHDPKPASAVIWLGPRTMEDTHPPEIDGVSVPWFYVELEKRSGHFAFAAAQSI